MEITTRLIKPSEAQTVKSISRRAFRGLEGVGIPKAKQAVVAVKDGKIAGAIQYKFYRAGGKKIGYFDYAFVDPDCHGQGIGSILYKATADFLWEQGCDALAALVKDDNVGSWGLFLKNGFVRISIPELVRQFGLFGMLRLYLGTVYSIAIGMDCYVAVRGQQIPSGKGGSVRQTGAYLLANALLPLLFLINAKGNAGAFLAAYGIYLAGGILAGYAGTLFSKRTWHFRLNNGGWLVCAFVNLISGVYPMTGNWYPDRYENSDGFRREMGLQALCGWAFTLALTLIPALAGGQHILLRYLGQIGSALLLYRMLPFYPFEAFGGGRIFRWSKAAFFSTAAVSLGAIALQSLQ